MENFETNDRFIYGFESKRLQAIVVQNYRRLQALHKFFEKFSFNDIKLNPCKNKNSGSFELISCTLSADN